MAPLSKKVIAWVAAGIATATAVLVVVLWWAGTSGLTGDKLVTARFDALRTGLSIGLGGGGLFALYLAWRRQHSTEIGLAQKQQDQADVARAYELQRETFETTRQHQERVAAATERDAEARRITDLYTKAADQLGSEKAPVRLAGLYALERLAQDHVEQRQTIINVLCAYLRMPDPGAGDPPGDDADDTNLTAHRERVQEREVRRAAQRILTTHLRPGADPTHPTDSFWADIDLDLTGATLINLDLTECHIRASSFTHAYFIGAAAFNDAQFTSDTWFDEARFTGVATFGKAQFTGVASFNETRFGDVTSFNDARFTDVAAFEEAQFTSDTWFEEAHFSVASFDGAQFTDDASFRKAQFTDVASFSQARFSGVARFSEAQFTRIASFDKARFTSIASFKKTEFTGDASFDKAEFAVKLPPEVAPFWSPPAEAGQQESDGTRTRQ